ncbi:uroporphyrinogen-III synthase [Phyllobacterium lublinensis]|uniref:uroporphyrinogen-III synthase n=1 Tax=Phyllobacterium lublinensis TaxID=2875708 RepID=UPI001CCFD55D|nr:uroporphyrinogen-III synthase [Phyllobacterium sp. 2063]MBZ9656552.1 uroporphyrinogen-III synthase [Phyllobacterium sp. 2063]
MRTVLVTRPQPGATKTAERLLCGGFLPMVLPLTEIVSLPAKHPDGTFHAVAVTSASALRQAPDQTLEPLLKLPCFVVGEATAAAARARGFETVTTGDGDGSSLAQTVIEELCTKHRILYLTGRVRAPAFEATLRKAGVHYRTLKTYDTVSVSYTTEFLVKFFSAGRIDCCLVYSHWGAEEFMRLMRREEIAHHFDRTPVFCLSSRIAEALAGLDRSLIHVSDRPDESALLELISRV